MDNKTLIHWGVKGQKWGVRRYQNKDGSLTPAGKKRYNRDYEGQARNMSDAELRSQINRMNLEKRYMDLSKSGKSRVSNALDVTEKATSIGSNSGKIAKGISTLKDKKNPYADTANQGINVISKTSKAANKITNMAIDKKAAELSRNKLSSLSDQDLRDTVNRMDLERQYSNLKRETVDRGKISASKVIDVAGDVVQVGASAVMLAVGIRKLLKE